MTWAKLKEKIEDHIVTTVFALIAFLCLIIWQAVPYETWIQVGTVIPKRALAALLGLLCILLATSVAYIFSLRRELRNIQAAPDSYGQASPKSQSAEPEVFDPDERDKEILRYLFQSNIDRILGIIKERLNFEHTEELKFRLNTLIKHGYIKPLRRPRPGRFPEYWLSDTGRGYVMRNLLKSDGDS